MPFLADPPCKNCFAILTRRDLAKIFPRKILAEREGFEPSIPFWSMHAFQACAFNHSAISPPGTKLWPWAQLDAIFFRLDGNVRTHLDTVLGRKVWAGSAGRLESRPNPRTGMSTPHELLSKPFRRSGVSAERRSLCLETGGWRRSAETPLRSFAIGSRSAGFPACGFWGLSSPQLRTVSRCTRRKASMQIQLDKMLSWSRLVLLTNDVSNFKPEPRN